MGRALKHHRQLREEPLVDYFIITQDNRIMDRFELVNISKSMFAGLSSEGEEPMQFFIKENSRKDYVDFTDRPVILVSDRFKEVLEIYCEQTVYFPVVLFEIKRDVQKLYWYLKPPKVDCLSEQTEFHKNGTLKRLVIKPDLAAGHRVFQIDRILENYMVIDLMVLESLLRRGYIGFRPELIEIESEAMEAL